METSKHTLHSAFGESVELQPMSAHKSSTKTQTGSHSTAISDDAYLARLGKKPLLPRNFGFMSILGFSCSALLTWEGVLISSVTALLNGGPAAVVWGFLINWIGVTSVNATIAELASIAPTAAGQYHWVSMLAPESSQAFLCYLTAWMTTIAWQAMVATSAFLLATLLQGMIVLGHPNYSPTAWQTVLLIWAIVLLGVLINSTTGRALAKLEGLILVLHLAGFFGILIPMVYLAPHNTPREVFTTFINEGGWDSQAVSFLVGFPTLASVLIGADGAVHLSEEIQSAAIVVPQAIMGAMVINGVLGFAMCLGMLFCLSDLDAALEASETLYYPFIEIFYSAVNSKAGAVSMATVMFVLALASSIGILASASRILWSFSRDKGMPLSKHLTKVTKNGIPIFAVLFTFAFTVVFSLIVLGSTTVFNNLLSLVFGALFSSYLLSSSLLLWRRTTGFFQPFDEQDSTTVLHHGRISWGPWRLREPFGTANNFFACCYSAFVFFWSFWPQDVPTTTQNANWSSLVFSAVILFSVVWYVVKARHHFKGPVREVL